MLYSSQSCLPLIRKAWAFPPPTCLHVVVQPIHCLLPYYCKLFWKWNFVSILSLFCCASKHILLLWIQLKRHEVIFIQSVNQELYHLNYAFAFALSGLLTAEWFASVHTENEKYDKSFTKKPNVTANSSLRCWLWNSEPDFYVSSLANRFIPGFLHPWVNIDPISSGRVTRISYCSVVVTNYCVRQIGLAREPHSSHTGGKRSERHQSIFITCEDLLRKVKPTRMKVTIIIIIVKDVEKCNY